MGSIAGDYDLIREFKRRRIMKLVNRCHQNLNQSSNCKQMLRIIRQPRRKQTYQERGYCVESMQCVLQDVFGLGRCRMKGNANNLSLFAAIDLTIQMHQLNAYR